MSIAKRILELPEYSKERKHFERVNRRAMEKYRRKHEVLKRIEENPRMATKD